MSSPILVLISSYKEGTLIQGAIRSALQIRNAYVLIAEGPTEGVTVEGDETSFGWEAVEWPNYECEGVRVFYTRGTWPNERGKRNTLMAMARGYGDCWFFPLDADEIIVWGEHIPDFLSQLRPGYPNSGENLVKLKLTEMSELNEHGNFSTRMAPRIIHSTMIAEYMVAGYMAKTPDNLFLYLGHEETEYPPALGEPHIHHRPYLRRPERKVLRLGAGEERRFLDDPVGFMKREHEIDYVPPPELKK